MERDAEHFDLDDEFVAESDDAQDIDKMMGGDNRRPRPSSSSNAAKKGKAAWSKLEDVLAERRLQKELEDFDKT